MRCVCVCWNRIGFKRLYGCEQRTKKQEHESNAMPAFEGKREWEWEMTNDFILTLCAQLPSLPPLPPLSLGFIQPMVETPHRGIGAHSKDQSSECNRENRERAIERQSKHGCGYPCWSIRY